ncbi:hypothetical protein DFA_07020 [Cavenderia fasciculata]|uniref:Uncharacterized protein n=1 Tax=Cavenderia fasciculata TaxID=261658 RepID=F4PXB0_CACFS|nr:uncharacterized protein DFA_07020 [Cavenderia fasciculata]EGG19913.1 hypothetical protein DFA_07020 [Cavenderia fasciculata]|eukprot:XP_004366896.1 hypothetical protein DFA_07020 [Cavenderia fasciculata]
MMSKCNSQHAINDIKKYILTYFLKLADSQCVLMWDPMSKKHKSFKYNEIQSMYFIKSLVVKYEENGSLKTMTISSTPQWNEWDAAATPTTYYPLSKILERSQQDGGYAQWSTTMVQAAFNAGSLPCATLLFNRWINFAALWC